MSLFYNSIFGIELFFNMLINPRYFFTSSWNGISLIVILSSIASTSLELCTRKDELVFLQTSFIALQLLRFLLLVKDVLFLKKFFRALHLIFMKSLPFFTLFCVTWYAYALIGIFLKFL